MYLYTASFYIWNEFFVFHKMYSYMKVPLFVPRYMIKKTVLVLFFQSDERTLELAVSSEKSCSFHSPSPASPPADRMGLPFKPGHIRSAVTLSNADPDLLDLYPARFF